MKFINAWNFVGNGIDTAQKKIKREINAYKIKRAKKLIGVKK